MGAKRTGETSDPGMRTKRRLISEYRDVINAIRRLRTGEKTELAAASDLSWPTVMKFIKTLTDNGAVRKQDGRFVVNRAYSYYVGISLGVSNIKLSLCDFSLRPMTESDFEAAGLGGLYAKLTAEAGDLADGWQEHKNAIYYRADDEFRTIRDRLNRIVGIVADACRENEGFSVLGIGIAGPGIINYNTKTFVFCPNVKCLEGFSTDRMLDEPLKKKLEERDIVLYWEHDSECAVLYAKEALYDSESPYHHLMDKRNVGCVYVGTGLGLGIVLDNRLIRGGSFSAGELGHILPPAIQREFDSNNVRESYDRERYYLEPPDASETSPKVWDETPHEMTKDLSGISCSCGKDNCLEKRLWLDVFNADSTEDYLEKAQKKYLTRFKQDHPYRYRLLEQYISCVLNIAINLFNFDIIVFSGRIINWIPELKNSLESLQHTSAIYNSSAACTIITENQESEPVTIGAAIAAYNKVKNDGGPVSVSWITPPPRLKGTNLPAET